VKQNSEFPLKVSKPIFHQNLMKLPAIKPINIRPVFREATLGEVHPLPKRNPGCTLLQIQLINLALTDQKWFKILNHFGGFAPWTLAQAFIACSKFQPQ
jgi:hypothetical protein